MRFVLLAWIGCAPVALLGCGSAEGADSTLGGEGAFQELYDQGLNRYVGMFAPTNEPDAVEGVKTYRFEVPSDLSAEPRGPLCLRGAEYTVDTREGSSDALVIFLQGGGACWDTFCEASTETSSISIGGILDPEFPDNPVADWDVAWVPYCDGSIFAGDIDRILPQSITEGGDPSMGYQRGLQNLTAALDVTVNEFPNPSRILLTGVSAGGFGTITALPLVRLYYPDTEIVLFNDSGVGVGNGADPSFINATLIDGWNAGSIIPESCPECTSNGHATRLIEWQLAADDNFTMSALSYNEDSVVADFFFMIGGEAFSDYLLEETTRTHDLFPTRYKRFIPEGAEHTALLTPTSTQAGFLLIGGLDEEIDGTNVLEFLTAQLDASDAWVDLVDPRVTAQ